MDRLLSRRGAGVAGALVLFAGLAAAPPASAGDPGQGHTVFASRCAMCHSAAKGGPTILGPTLWGVVGRPAGTVKGFAYSSGMKGAGFTWSNDRLRIYLPKPNGMVPGTKMTFAGLKNPTQIDDLIAYLNTLK
ncbi:MAG: cytochrome c family protein [Proteobacteria bacterium]|nr:cytochrome c family protein [Pseudomonadota bacterium]